MTSRNLPPAALFFYRNAAYSYPTGAAKPDMYRVQGAVALAAAETLLSVAQHALELSVDWEVDPDGHTSAGNSEGPWFSCCIRLDDIVIASLSGIDQPDEAAKRVVVAELAMECEATLTQALHQHGARYHYSDNARRSLSAMR